MKVLICEDELIIAEDLKETCDAAGYTVTGIAETLAMAMAALAQDRPDVILLDINLDGHFEGLTIAQDLRKRFEIPFLFITAYTDADTISRAIATQPLAYLVKPVDPVTLVANLKLAAFKLQPQVLPPKPALLQLGKDAESVAVDQVHYVQAFANYMEMVFADGKKTIVRATMTQLEEAMPDSFVRIHKSYLVQRKFLNGISASKVIVGAQVIPVGRAYLKNIGL
jgi:two-component system, LytTR family, response regulator LytT